jgi:hypothetical protein
MQQNPAAKQAVGEIQHVRGVHGLKKDAISGL